MLLSQAFSIYIEDRITLSGGKEKTAKNYISVCNNLMRVIGNPDIRLITYQTVLTWRQDMELRGLSSSTIYSNLVRLREVLRYWKKHGHDVIDYDSIELPKVVIAEKDFLYPSEVQQMLDYTAVLRDKALIATLFSSGGRINEVLSLNRDSIITGKATVLGKGDRFVTLRIDETASKLIAEYIETRSDYIPAIFVSAQRRRLTIQRAEQIISQISSELAFSRSDGRDKIITPHSFRHSFGTNLLLNGADLFTVQKLMNHQKISSTQKYMHLEPTKEDDLYNKFHSVIRHTA